MTPDRWKLAEKVLDAALELESQKRAAFLDEACAGDEELKREIERLLASDKHARSFTEASTLARSSSGKPKVVSNQELGPYRIVSLLGAGGMGEVYAAEDTRLKRKVAIKLLPAHLSGNQVNRIRFEREAHTISSLSHPNICSLYDIGQHEGIDYLVMEYLEGKTLFSLIRKGPLPVKMLLNLAIGIADGLAAAHRAGIIHRDLKPGNIMVTAEGHVKILDFGLAKLRNPVAEQQETASGSLTQTGIIQGTVPYMSPEQASGNSVDFRSDQFSFGLILYEMATGKKAFDRDTATQTLAAIIAEDPVPLATLNPKTPAPVAWIVERCMAKDPQERYESTHDLAKDIRALPDRLSRSGTSAPASAAGKKKVQMIWNIAAASLILVLLAAAVILYNKSSISSPISYHRLTYRRGYISTARFAPDGHTIVYSGAFQGNPKEMFTTRTQGVDSRSLGIQNADILSISASGEMALLLNEKMKWFDPGVLAVVPLSGGAPREIIDDVFGACWTPDGSKLAVARRVSKKTRIELPLGNVIYETSDFIRELRISPDGAVIAFHEHPTTEAILGSVNIIDMAGKTLASSAEIIYPEGSAWRTSKELWIIATAKEAGGGSELYGLNRLGKERLIQRFPHSIVHDISSSGSMLLGFTGGRGFTVGLLNGVSQEQDLSWLDGTEITDISNDGSMLLLGESGEGGEGVMGSAYLRMADGSAAMRLEIGIPRNLSQDGKFALVARPYESRLLLVPTRAGETKSFSIEGYRTDNIFPSPTLFPDGKRILFRGKEKGHSQRIYVQDVSGKKPYPITEVDVDYYPHTISPDGKFFIGIRKDEKVYLFPIEGGTPRPIAGISEEEWPFQWSHDGRYIYLRNVNSLPVEIYRLNPVNGERKLVKRWSPNDPTGITEIYNVRMTPDEKNFVFSFLRAQSTLYLVDGLLGRSSSMKRP